MSERLGLDDLRVHALTTIGSGKDWRGDVTGRDDLELAIEIGRASNSPALPAALNNLSVVIDTWDGGRMRTSSSEALREAERFGDIQMARLVRGNLIVTDWLLGDWDEAVPAADAFVAECESGAPHIREGPLRLVRAYIALAREHRDVAPADLRCALELARAIGDLDALIPALVRTAWADLQIGRVSEARVAFAEVVPLLRKHPKGRSWSLAEVAYDLGETSDVREVLAGLPSSPGHKAMIAVLHGDFVEAAALYAEAGILLFEAEARLRAAEQLLGKGRRAEGEAQLEKALVFYRPIGATLFVERGERLLAKSA